MGRLYLPEADGSILVWKPIPCLVLAKQNSIACVSIQQHLSVCHFRYSYPEQRSQIPLS